MTIIFGDFRTPEKTLPVEKAADARRSDGSYRSVLLQYVRMRARSDNEAGGPYRRADNDSYP